MNNIEIHMMTLFNQDNYYNDETDMKVNYTYKFCESIFK